MGYQMKYAPGPLLAMACLLAAGATQAQSDMHAGAQGAGAALLVSNDSEGFSSRRAALEYLPRYGARDAYAGVRYLASRHGIDGWSRSASQLSAVYRSIDPATANGVQAEAGLSRQGGHELLTVDATWHAPLAERSSVELFVNRDWVETRAALDNGVSFTLAGAAFEQGLGRHLTAVAMAGYQDFSDGNARRHLRAKLIYQPDLELGLTLQARYRLYRSDTDAARAYFNPERYAEAMLAVGFRKRVQGWMGSATAGVGTQRVADSGRSPTRLLELGLESPARASVSLRLRAGLNKSASFGGPDYTFRYAQAEWLLGF